MKNSNEKLTILVNSCDAYKDLWQPFFILLKKYWQGPLPEIVLNTESEKFSFDGLDIRCVNSNERFYGKRLKNALRNVRTPYVLLLLDDFFIRKEVNTDRLYRTIEYMDSDSRIACFNFEKRTGAVSEKYSGYVTLPAVCDYKLNMQAALWRKTDLDDLWKDKESPWDWEVYGNLRTYFSDRKFYYLAPDRESPIDYGKKAGLTWGVVRGKWCRDDVVPLFEKENISVDFSHRGFFQPQDEEPRTGRPKVIKKQLYSAGAAFVIKDIAYSVVYRRFMKLFGKDTGSYTDYLKRKYNK